MPTYSVTDDNNHQTLVNGHHQNRHSPGSNSLLQFDPSLPRGSPTSPGGSTSPASSTSATDQRLMHEKFFGTTDLGTLDNLHKYLPLPYPPSIYTGLMGHMPFFVPNTSGATSTLFPGDGAQLAAMRQLHAHLGHNHRFLADSLQDTESAFSNGGNSLIKSPKVRRFSPYSVPTVSSADNSAFYRLAGSQSLPTLPVTNESDSPPSPKDSPTKV